MNYQHQYHAGNFSDVFKHSVLLAIFQYLFQKEKPFCYLDSHAGKGFYDLSSQESQATQEWQSGILKIKDASSKPKIIADYWEIVASCNLDNTLKFYPGSPMVAEKSLRLIDKMIFVESESTVFSALKNQFKLDKRIVMHQQDGYRALNAFLPPKEKRGIVLIDPPYENTNEVDRLCNALNQALKKWPQGIYAIWYPIKRLQEQPLFIKKIKYVHGEIPALNTQLLLKKLQPGLQGCGMYIINPPWQFEKMLTTFVPWLEELYS